MVLFLFRRIQWYTINLKVVMVDWLCYTCARLLGMSSLIAALNLKYTSFIIDTVIIGHYYNTKMALICINIHFMYSVWHRAKYTIGPSALSVCWAVL